MSKCEFCNQDMSDNNTNSCKFSKVIIDNIIYNRIDVTKDDIIYGIYGLRCHDCNILIGEGNYHHFGCDMEQCPKCGEQFGFCNCNKKEFLN